MTKTQRDAYRREIERLTAEYIKKNGPIQTLPIITLEDILNGKVASSVKPKDST